MYQRNLQKEELIGRLGITAGCPLFEQTEGNAVNNPVASTSTDNTHNKKNNLIQLLKERLFPIKK